MPGSSPGYHNPIIAAVALLEWFLVWIQDGISSIFPSHSQAQFRRIRDQEPFPFGSLHTVFLLNLLL